MKLDKRYILKVSEQDKEVIEGISEELERITDKYDVDLSDKELSQILFAIANGWDSPNGELEDIVNIVYEE